MPCFFFFFGFLQVSTTPFVSFFSWGWHFEGDPHPHGPLHLGFFSTHFILLGWFGCSHKLGFFLLFSTSHVMDLWFFFFFELVMDLCFVAWKNFSYMICREWFVHMIWDFIFRLGLIFHKLGLICLLFVTYRMWLFMHWGFVER